MMSFCKMYIYVWVIVCMSACFVDSLNRIEIKALIPREKCDIKQLFQGSDIYTTVRCSRFERMSNYLVSNKTVCQVTSNKTVFQYQCVDRVWKLSKGTYFHLRSKRFFDQIEDFFNDIEEVIHCFIEFGKQKCVKKPAPKIYEAPKYTVCPPSDIQPLYIAGRKETEVVVTWTDPIATDDREVISNEQIHGVSKGEKFKGLPNEGYEHSIIYRAKDGDRLTANCDFTFTVKYLTCGAPPTLQNGKKVSCPDSTLYGSECLFECESGYEIIGSNLSTCQQNETWDNFPICQKIRCDNPFEIENGNVICDSTNYEFDDDCLFKCNEGFKLNGPLKMVCRANKKWSSDSNEVRCVDDDPPVITCSTQQVFYADRGSFNTSVTWDFPTATDNFDSNVSIIQTSGPAQGSVLTEGVHAVEYKTTDIAGNSLPQLSECTIFIEVKVIKCSTGPTDALDNARFMMFNCTDMMFYNGVSCTLSCDLNLPLNGTNILVCERDGLTNKGIWTWGSVEQPFCEVVECPHLDPPKNGSLTTDSINARPLHVMLCRSGFDIPSVGSEFVGRLSCQDSGKWYPLDAFPDCIISVLPWLNLPLELYHEGDCNDNATKIRIKEQVLAYLSGVEDDIDNSICPDVETCKIEFLNVECGETSGRKRKSFGFHSIQKRNAFTLITLAVLKKWVQGDKTVQEIYTDSLADLNSIADKLQQDAHNGDIVNVTGLILPNDGVQRGTPVLSCDPGYKVDTGSLTCKPCPPGTYLDADTGYCEFCKIGEYMDHEGSIQCDRCPEGYSTLSTGAKEMDKCLKLCSQGFVSSTTMEPCSACQVGTYQPEYGQAECISCPSGKATNGTNGVSENDCNYFDVHINGLSQKTDIGSFTANQTSDFTLSVWLKVQDIANEDMAISISDSVGDLVNLFVGSEVSVQAGTGKVALSNNRLSARFWTHIICLVDIASGTLQLYVGGSLKVNESNIAIEKSRTLSSGIVKVFAESNGLYISGLVLYDHTLSQTDMTSLSNSCVGKLNGEILEMSGILPNVVNGITVITPTSCDPIDECANDPCGNHTCVNMVNAFKCICHGGMTGDLCDIPPDYCINNQCVQGVCQSGNGSYSCHCNDTYTGEFCNINIVNGEWSSWSSWSQCNVTCNGGITFRKRYCNNPIPSPGGKDCEGESTEYLTCNDNSCPNCTQLKREFGTNVNCYNVSSSLQKCNMTCLPGRALTNGQAPFVEYTCGHSTNYEWLPTDKVPGCVEVKRPDFLGIRTTVSYSQTIQGSAQTGIITEVENNLSENSCISNGECKVKITVANGNQSRKRRSSSTTLTVDVSTELKDAGDLDVPGFLSNGSETSSMTELIGALTSINDVITFIENNTEEIFQVTVDNTLYNLENTSPDFVATVTCPSGYAGAEGLCALCPAGTYLVDIQCIDCEVGTYQPLTGQLECLPCPYGYTTARYASSNASECSVPVEEIEDTDSHDEDYDDKERSDKSNDNVTIIAVSVIFGGLFVFLVTTAGILVLKKELRRRFRTNNKTGSFVSLSMVRSSTSLSNVVNNYHTQFNAKAALSGITNRSVDTEMDNTESQDESASTKQVADTPLDVDRYQD